MSVSYVNECCTFFANSLTCCQVTTCKICYRIYFNLSIQNSGVKKKYHNIVYVFRMLWTCEMAARIPRFRSTVPLLRSSGRLWATLRRPVAMHRSLVLSNSPSTLYSTSPAGRAASVVGRFVKRQTYILLLVGGISSGALLLVSAAVCGPTSDKLL